MQRRYGVCIIIRGWDFGKSSGNLAVVRGVHLIWYGSRVWMEYGRGGGGRRRRITESPSLVWSIAGSESGEIV